MVPLVIPFVPMVMPMVPLALPMVPLVSQWLPMVPLVKLPMVPLGEPRTEPVWAKLSTLACVHGSTNGTNGRPISFKVLPMVPLVIPLVPMVPLIKTDGSQYCRQSTVWAKLPTLQSHMIKYGVLNFKFIHFTNKHCFYQDDIRK